MIDEKQYTQSDINAAICKAITDLQAVNERLNKIIMRKSQTGNAPNVNAVKNYIYECIEHASPGELASIADHAAGVVFHETVCEICAYKETKECKGADFCKCGIEEFIRKDGAK